MRKRPPQELETAFTTLNVRGIDATAVAWIKTGAAARGIRIGEYLARLVALHDHMRRLANTDAAVRTKLEALGLQTVMT